MNTQSEVMASLEANVTVPVVIPASRRLYWSVRRELWENRAIYIAPLAVAAVFLVAFLIGAIHPPVKMQDTMALDPMRHQDLVEQPYTFAAFLFMGTTFFVAMFYCLEALYSERRDRSILFWKSLPVSDLTTVLAKLSIPLVILPLATFAITIVTQWIMLLLSSALMLARGQSAAALWSHLPLFQMSLMLFFHVVAVHGLQFAPIYSWMLLVSSWARRAPLLWAVLPPLAIGVAERVAFPTSPLAALLRYLLGGGPEVVTGKMQMLPLTPLAVGEFFINPGLWIGLAVAAVFLAAAVRLRRYREPI
jgi:ABC-2 type transport system permease protein